MTLLCLDCSKQYAPTYPRCPHCHPGTGLVLNALQTRMADMLKAAGDKGMSGAEVCAALDIEIDSLLHDQAALLFAKLPTNSRRDGNHYVYIWAGTS